MIRISRLALACALLSPLAVHAQGVPINQLPAAGVLSGSEVMPAVQSGAAVQLSVNQIATYIIGANNGWSGTNTFTGTVAMNGTMTGTGSVVLNGATGGSQGAGTINATGLFVNGVAVGGGIATVTLAAPSWLSVAGSPCNTATCALTLSMQDQSANTVLAAPDAASGVPTFRALVSDDIPPIDLASTAHGGVTNILPVSSGGTGVDTLTGIPYANGTGNFTTATTAQLAGQLAGGVIPNTIASPALTINDTFSGGGTVDELLISATSNANGASIKLLGNGSTTPSKTIRVQNGLFEVCNDALNACVFQLADSGSAGFAGTVTAPTFSGNLSGTATVTSLTASGTASFTGPVTLTGIGSSLGANYICVASSGGTLSYSSTGCGTPLTQVGMPINTISAAYTVSASDCGTEIVSDVHTISFPITSLPVPCAITILATGSGGTTIDVTSGALYRADGGSGSGNRVISPPAVGASMAVISMFSAGNAVITGTGIS